MKVIAVAVKAKELEPGDLFSREGPLYWENIDSKSSLGEKAYIRTNTPTPPDDNDYPLYRLDIEREE